MVLHATGQGRRHEQQILSVNLYIKTHCTGNDHEKIIVGVAHGDVK